MVDGEGVSISTGNSFLGNTIMGHYNRSTASQIISMTCLITDVLQHRFRVSEISRYLMLLHFSGSTLHDKGSLQSCMLLETLLNEGLP